MNTISRLNEKFSLKQILVTSFLVVALPLASVVIAHDDDKSPNATNHEMNNGSHCEHGGKMHHGMGDHDMDKPGMPPYLRGLQLSTAQEDQTECCYVFFYFITRSVNTSAPSVP